MSPFRIGLVLCMVGTVWLGVEFSDTAKGSGTFELEEATSADVGVLLEGPSLGYYTIYMPEFAGDEVFVQVLDPRDNVIQEQYVGTRMIVGYFDYVESGTYVAKVSSISGGMIDVEIGGADSRSMIFPGAVLISGVALMMVAAYHRMVYSMAQPDENIS